MIVGQARSSEVFEVEAAVGDLVQVHAVMIADTRERFDRAARAWLIERHSGCSGGFADVVVTKAWARHTVRAARLELTASELAQLADLLAAAPATMAVEALRDKVAGAAERMGLAFAVEQEPAPETNGDAQ